MPDPDAYANKKKKASTGRIGIGGSVALGVKSRSSTPPGWVAPTTAQREANALKPTAEFAKSAAAKALQESATAKRLAAEEAARLANSSDWFMERWAPAAPAAPAVDFVRQSQVTSTVGKRASAATPSTAADSEIERARARARLTRMAEEAGDKQTEIRLGREALERAEVRAEQARSRQVQMGLEAEAALKQKALAEMQRTNAFFNSNMAPETLNMVMRGLGGGGKPKPLDMLANNSFDTANPKQMKYVQEWLGTQGKPVAVDGVFGKETFDALDFVLKREQKKSYDDEVKRMKQAFYETGILKGTGVTAEKMVADLMSGTFNFKSSSAYMRALQVYNERQGMPVTVEAYRKALVKNSMSAFGFNDFSTSPWSPRFVQIPDALANAPDGVEVDRILKEIQDAQTVQRLRGEAVAASQDRAWWGVVGSALLDAVAWSGERSGQVAYTVLASSPKRTAGKGITGKTTRFEADQMGVGEAWNNYEKAKEENPWGFMVLESLTDPLNWISGVGLISGASRVARAGVALAKFEDEASLGFRIVTSSTKALTKGAELKRARDLLYPMLRGLTSPASDYVKWTAMSGGLLGRSAVVAKTAARTVDLATVMTGSAKAARLKVRETSANLMRTVGDAMPGSLSRLPPELRSLVEDLDPVVKQRVVVQLKTTQTDVLETMSRGLPEVVRSMDLVQSRLFYETVDGSRKYTQAGARMEAHLNKEAFVVARNQMIREGKAKLSDFGGSHFVAPRARIAREFMGYKSRVQDLVEQVWLPVMDGHAAKMNYGFELSDEMADLTGDMLTQAFDDVVDVFNPNRFMVFDWASPEELAEFEVRIAEKQRLLAELGPAQARLRELRDAGWRGYELAESQNAVNVLKERIAGIDTATIDEKFAVWEQAVHVLDERMYDARMETRRLVRRLEGLDVERIGDRSASVVWVEERLVEQRAGLAKWESIKEDLRFFEGGADTFVVKRQVDDMIESIGKRIELFEEIAQGSARTFDIDKARRAFEYRDMQWDARLDDLVNQGNLEAAMRLYDELILTDELRVVRLGLDDMRREQVGVLGHEEFFRSRVRDGGARLASTVDMNAAKDMERGSWAYHIGRKANTDQARGVDPASAGHQVQSLADKEMELARAWRETAPGSGQWEDTRQTLSIPKMYQHGNVGGQNWVDTGMALDPAARREVRVAFEGWNPYGANPHDVAMTPRYMPEERVLVAVQETTAELDDLARQLNAMEDLGSDAASRTVISARIQRLEGELAALKKESMFNVGGVPVEQIDSAMASDFMKNARMVEKELLGRAGRVEGAEEMGQALLRRELALSELENVTKGALMKREGLYWHALGYHRATPLRAIQSGIEGATSVWRFATLPLRLGWVVGNTLDNFVKCFIAGLRDPRYLIVGTKSIFAIGIYPLRAIVRQLDKIKGTNAARHLDALLAQTLDMEHGWLARICALENIPIPADVAENTLYHFVIGARGSGKIGVNGSLWALMGGGPEELFRKALYRDVYAKALKAGKTVEDAMKDGMRAVDDTLFDYSDLTTLEDNIRVLLPFITFWKKNMAFWPQAVIDHPWFLADTARYVETLAMVNEDKPEWMRRYISLDCFADVTNRLGMRWLSGALKDAAFDPLDLFSFAPLYRAFKMANMTLNKDQTGIFFINSIIDAFDKYGLGSNPLVRKPMELFGLVDAELWRSAFPQNDLIQAFTRKFWSDRFPDGIDLEAWISDPFFRVVNAAYSAIGFEGLGSRGTPLEFNARSFEDLVKLEIANQVQRGEIADEMAARDKVRNYLASQQVVGYFLRVYTRRLSVEDISLYQALDQAVAQEWDEMEPIYTNNPGFASFMRYRKDKKAGELGSEESVTDAVTFARWANVEGAWRAYNLVPWDKRDAYLLEHPEIAAWVLPTYSVNYPLSKAVKYEQFRVFGEEFYRMQDLLDQLPASVSPAEREYLLGAIKTPELEEFWRANDTPWEEAMAQGRLMFDRYYDDLNKAYFAIPADDYDARDSFLEANPILSWFWNRYGNDEPGTVAQRLQRAGTASLREIWGAYVDAGDWESANAFMKENPFMFIGTSAEDKVNADGTWKSSRGGRRYVQSQHSKDYLAVRVVLDGYFRLGAEDYAAKEAYLAAHPELARYFEKYSVKKEHKELSERAKAYLAVKDVLEEYFWYRKDDYEGKKAYLAEHPELSEYFARYGEKKELSEKAQDYLKVQEELKLYFAAPKESRDSFLKAHPNVQAYFDKYGDGDPLVKWRAEHEFEAAQYDFWKAYFALPEGPERYEFGKMYGLRFGFDERTNSYGKQLSVDARMRIVERGATAGNEHANDYIEAKPLLAEYFALPTAEARGLYLDEHPALQRYFEKWAKPQTYVSTKPANVDTFFTLVDEVEKTLFLEMHPEVREYFQKYGRPLSADPVLEATLEAYFALPRFSRARDEYLADHPAIKEWFSSSNVDPEQAAISDLLQEYFSLSKVEKKTFIAGHPELQVWFDEQKAFRHQLAARRLEEDMKMGWLADLYQKYADIYFPQAELIRMTLRRWPKNLELASRNTGRKPVAAKRR